MQLLRAELGQMRMTLSADGDENADADADADAAVTPRVRLGHADPGQKPC